MNTLSPAAEAFYSQYPEAFPQALSAAYGVDVAEFVQGKVSESMGNGDDYECSDSYRFAVVGNDADEARYEEMVSCCGQADFTFDHPSGVSFRFGFNYGH